FPEKVYELKLMSGKSVSKNPFANQGSFVKNTNDSFSRIQDYFGN
ncbi:UNVERIFIED_CONTAM: ATP-dependent helicase, partial [Salmonella enterica subsp. enterica serovar Weltevreden]